MLRTRVSLLTFSFHLTLVPVVHQSPPLTHPKTLRSISLASCFLVSDFSSELYCCVKSGETLTTKRMVQSRVVQ